MPFPIIDGESDECIRPDSKALQVFAGSYESNGCIAVCPLRSHRVRRWRGYRWSTHHVSAGGSRVAINDSRGGRSGEHRWERPSDNLKSAS
jgi:hypothetical protein